jgi:hypothetical protein
LTNGEIQKSFVSWLSLLEELLQILLTEIQVAELILKMNMGVTLLTAGSILSVV